jgi:hypothetical protein
MILFNTNGASISHNVDCLPSFRSCPIVDGRAKRYLVKEISTTAGIMESTADGCWKLVPIERIADEA